MRSKILWLVAVFLAVWSSASGRPLNIDQYRHEWSCPSQRVSSARPDIAGNQVGEVCALTPLLLQSDGWFVVDGKGHSGAGLSGFATLAERIQRYRDAVKSAPQLADGLPTGVVKLENTFNPPDNSERYRIVVAVSKYRDDLDTDTRVFGLEREFCAADPTNSLSEGSSFRRSLEAKYGIPKRAETAVDQVSALERERAEKVAALNKVRAALADSMTRDQAEILEGQAAYSLALVDEDIKRAKLENDRVLALAWVTATGQTILVREHPHGCGARGSRFVATLALPQSEMNAFFSEATASKKSFDSRQPSQAEVPRL